MKLTTTIGLPVAPVTMGTAGDIDYLLIERYDRIATSISNQPSLDRIHQGDFCQAMGFISERKYQSEVDLQ